MLASKQWVKLVISILLHFHVELRAAMFKNMKRFIRCSRLSWMSQETELERLLQVSKTKLLFLTWSVMLRITWNLANLLSDSFSKKRVCEFWFLFSFSSKSIFFTGSANDLLSLTSTAYNKRTKPLYKNLRRGFLVKCVKKRMQS